MKVFSTMLILALLSLIGTSAHAKSERYKWRKERYAPVVTEARGCYWFRGRLYCSRYCYTEVNGYRYCQERAWNAVPQAPIW